MLCAFLHPWGERTLQRIDKLNLQTRLLIKTVIVAGEAGFLPHEQCRCSPMLPILGQAGGSVLMRPSAGSSFRPASCLLCHLTSLPAVAAHFKRMQWLLTKSLALCQTMLPELPPPGKSCICPFARCTWPAGDVCFPLDAV